MSNHTDLKIEAIIMDEYFIKQMVGCHNNTYGMLNYVLTLLDIRV